MQSVSSPLCLPRRRLATASGDRHTAQTCSVHQRGAGLIEFGVVAIPILLMGLGGIELAHWLLTRQAVSLALLEAGRAGITTHARPQTMASAFEQALLPLFTASSAPSARQKRQAAFHQRRRDTRAPAWQIELLSPSSAAFNDFSDPALADDQFDRLPTINNHYQFEQDRRLRAQGWPGGQGPESGMSIYQANTLVLRLTYLHEPIVPGMKGLMRLLGKQNGTYGQHAMAHGYLPIKRQISLTMQSHPVHWPMLNDGTIVRPGAASFYSTGNSVVPCTGMWCSTPRGTPAPARPNVPLNEHDVSDGAGETSVARPSPPPVPATGQPEPDTDLAVSPDDPACGVTLCCAAV